MYLEIDENGVSFSSGGAAIKFGHRSRFGDPPAPMDVHSSGEFAGDMCTGRRPNVEVQTVLVGGENGRSEQVGRRF